MTRVSVFQRLFGRTRDENSTPPAIMLLGGGHDLEVVGESHYQDALWHVVGGRTLERVRVEIRAVLQAETDNPYDPNAISVWISERKVGYLSREDAAAYRGGLEKLEARDGKKIALRGVVVGGGVREDGPGFLGVWMSHDPTDFGIAPIVPAPVAALRGSMRTGLTEALLTDEEDDSYDLSWLARLPSDPIAAIARLRQLLREDPDPIDRHFMYCEIEERLYRSRDAFTSALDEYDDTCARHDGEMNGIRDALLTKFGRVPMLETYRQMAVRQQKAKNWAEAIRWAERGLALYGSNAARPEAVDDLRKRITAYTAKLSGTSPVAQPAPASPTKPRHSSVPGPATDEILTCASCGKTFTRAVTRGRKPTRCLACR